MFAASLDPACARARREEISTSFPQNVNLQQKIKLRDGRNWLEKGPIRRYQRLGDIDDDEVEEEEKEEEEKLDLSRGSHSFSLESSSMALEHALESAP